MDNRLMDGWLIDWSIGRFINCWLWSDRCRCCVSHSRCHESDPSSAGSIDFTGLSITTSTLVRRRSGVRGRNDGKESQQGLVVWPVLLSCRHWLTMHIFILRTRRKNAKHVRNKHTRTKETKHKTTPLTQRAHPTRSLLLFFSNFITPQPL